VRSMMEGEVSEPGAWMPEQVINPPVFFSRIAERGLTVELSAIAQNLSGDSNAVRPEGHHVDRH
jgi:hypothetical protein